MIFEINEFFFIIDDASRASGYKSYSKCITLRFLNFKILWVKNGVKNVLLEIIKILPLLAFKPLRIR